MLIEISGVVKIWCPVIEMNDLSSFLGSGGPPHLKSLKLWGCSRSEPETLLPV